MIFTLTSSGYNPFFWSEQDLLTSFIQDEEQIAPFIKNSDLQLFFYGAGLGSEENKEIILSALKKVFYAKSIFVEDDLFGAARGLLQSHRGIACILGTGANSGYYTGKKLANRPVSLGYLLSDFGSGATIGLAFLKLLLTNKLNITTVDSFIEEFDYSTEYILKRLYKEERPNAFCASFAPFIIKSFSLDDAIKQMLEEQMSLFVDYYVLPFVRSKKELICITGSIAHHFNDFIEEAFKKFELQAPTIVKSPSQGLIDYHMEKNN
ncbi:hypothetical protein [Flammeovirga pacifica]|uniref:ATPase BadF/BadG/BcrA/BcrD type domain-containing protein n=1 Tax=Flammeovirga pacifica TaxID=915059 RepID=A0A1S1Z331_FLAPC|nr:hypothetical protein [Flammeovirga pacifica]OHX67688.1 hypothetical protein NH26_15680 [Flammeovirga pacifica]